MLLFLLKIFLQPETVSHCIDGFLFCCYARKHGDVSVSKLRKLNLPWTMFRFGRRNIFWQKLQKTNCSFQHSEWTVGCKSLFTVSQTLNRHNQPMLYKVHFLSNSFGLLVYFHAMIQYKPDYYYSCAIYIFSNWNRFHYILLNKWPKMLFSTTVWLVL